MLSLSQRDLLGRSILRLCRRTLRDVAQLVSSTTEALLLSVTPLMLMDTSYYHLVIYCPVEAADNVRRAIAEAGAGRIGNYDSCSFSSRGTGRFRGNEKSNPAIGTPGTVEEVEEERIEVVAPKAKLQAILRAAVKAHPYEEPAIHVLPMIDYKDLL